MSIIVRFVRFVDRMNESIGRGVSWLTLALVLITFVVVILRYVFSIGWVWLQESYVWVHGIVFMLGAGYALSRGVHIRADFLYRNWSPRTQGIVDASLYIVFYFPGMLVFLWMATDFATLSWIRGERGMDTAWMPFMGPIKTALPVGVFFLLLQGVSELLKSLYAVTRGRWP